MNRLLPYVLVLVALSLLLCAALVNRIPPDVEVETVPHQLNPSPSDGEPASYSYVLPTTTTTAPSAPKHNLSRKTRGELFGAATGRCGGDLPPCWVMMRESGGDIHAYNPTGCSGYGCFGKWQFSGEWACHFGLSCDIASWTEAEQDHAARTLWAGGRGCSHWAAC